MYFNSFLVFLIVIKCVNSQELREKFLKCRHTSPDFDECMKNVLNTLNYLFPTGVPEYHIPPLDPFFANEVEYKRENNLMFFRLKVINVTESGWTNSTVNKFKSDLDNYKVTITQNWPDKRLSGNYIFETTLLRNTVAVRNKGSFNLTLLGFNQETEITRRPDEFDEQGRPLIRVNVRIQNSDDIILHISNLFFGHNGFENVIDNIINLTWRPFFPLTKSMINELVSKAFTPIFTKAFSKVPLEKFFPG